MLRRCYFQHFHFCFFLFHHHPMFHFLPPNLHNFSFYIISFKLWELYLATKGKEGEKAFDTVLIWISLMQTFYNVKYTASLFFSLFLLSVNLNYVAVLKFFYCSINLQIMWVVDFDFYEKRFANFILRFCGGGLM